MSARIILPQMVIFDPKVSWGALTSLLKKKIGRKIVQVKTDSVSGLRFQSVSNREQLRRRHLYRWKLSLLGCNWLPGAAPGSPHGCCLLLCHTLCTTLFQKDVGRLEILLYFFTKTWMSLIWIFLQPRPAILLLHDCQAYLKENICEVLKYFKVKI